MRKKVALIVAIALAVVAGSGFTWVWTSFDDTGQYAFEFSGSDSVTIVNTPRTGDGISQLADRLEVEVGHEFSLTLDSNPTTGYRWELIKPLDGSVLELLSKEYVASDTELLGASGKEEWTFRAVGQGTTEISLQYVRPWEENTLPVVTKTFVVVVNPAAEAPTDDEYAGQEVIVPVGGLLTITLESNPSTGFQWELTGISDPTVLELVGHEFIAPEATDDEIPIVGAPGTEVWNFRALRVGRSTIFMEYSQPWEGGTKATQTFVVTVVVK